MKLRSALAGVVLLCLACSTDPKTQTPIVTVTGVSPTEGPTAGGTVVTVTGTGFGLGTGVAATVTFGGSAGSNVSVTGPTSASVTTPAHAAGAVDVVIAFGTTSVTVPNAYTYTDAAFPAPTLTAVAPATGPVAGGTVVTLTGTAFRAGATVSFGGAAATAVSVASATSITCTAPAHAAGAVDVTVTNADAKSATKAAAYTYAAPAPTLASLSPASGAAAGGTSVTLTGTGFAGAATVTFGGAAATGVTVASSTSVTATTPAHAAGAVDVVLTIGGTPLTLAGAYTYTSAGFPAPTLTTVAPATGDVAGGTSVTLTGTGFRSGATVTFGGAAASNVVVATATSVTCTTPAHAAGAVDVVLTSNDSQSATKASGFTYTATTAAPAIASLNPASGPADGGTSVTIAGTGFAAGALVRFGGVAAACDPITSAITVTCTTPAHSAGKVDVTLTNPDTQVATKALGFEFLAVAAAPTLTSVVPGSGPIAGGTAVVLTGTGFTAQTVVTFGDTALPATLIDATHLSVVTPASDGPAVVDVSVANTGFDPASEVEAFTWYPPASEVIVAVNGTVNGHAAGLLVFAPDASGEVPPNGDSLFAQQTDDLTKLVAPSRLFVQPGGSLFAINSYPQNDGALLEFAWQTGQQSPAGKWNYGHFTGNVAPVNATTNPVEGATVFNQPTGLAWDDTAQQVIVASYISGDLVWLDPTASGEVAPLRTLKTRGGGVGGIYCDDRYQEVLVVNGNSGTVDVYDEAATGTSTPKRTLTIQDYNPDVAHGGDYAVDLYLNGDELFVLLTHSLQVFPRTGSGTLQPTRTIKGANVGFTYASGLGYDIAQNLLYVADRGAGTQGVYVFDRAADGNAAPLRSIKGPGTDLADPIGVYVNHDAHDCHAGPAVLGNPKISLWWDAACGKSMGVTSAGVVSWTDRKAGVVLTASGSPAYGFNHDLTTMSVQNGTSTGFTAADVSGALLGPSDQFTFYGLYSNNRQPGDPGEYTNGVLFGWDTDATGDPAHVRVHAPYADGNFYFDTGTLASGRLQAQAPTGWSGQPHVLAGQRTGATATLFEDALVEGRSLGAASELSGGIDTTLKGTVRVAVNQPGYLGELLVITGPLSADDNLVIASYFSDKWYYNW
jgi:hypothetical protein